jgi:hypothetical protein
VAKKISVDQVLSENMIQSLDLIKLDSVVIPEKDTDRMKVKAAVAIAAASLLVGTVFLAVSIFVDDKELRAWATGLISLVVGASIGFLFGGGNGTQN